MIMKQMCDCEFPLDGQMINFIYVKKENAWLLLNDKCSTCKKFIKYELNKVVYK